MVSLPYLWLCYTALVDNAIYFRILHPNGTESGMPATRCILTDRKWKCGNSDKSWK